MNEQKIYFGCSEEIKNNYHAHLPSIALDGDLDLVLDENYKVIEKNVITILVSFPLETPFFFDLESYTGQGFTHQQLFRQIAQIYRDIYQIESETSTIKPFSISSYHARNLTNGVFGLWGYYLDNLRLTSITKRADQNYYRINLHA